MTIYLTPPVSGGGGGAVASGTTTTEGTVRLATTTEAQDVNNETLAVTPKGLNAQISAAVAGGVTYQGVIAGDSIPTLTSATQGDLYKISVASTGVVAGFNWAVNDNLLINADMGGTFDAAKVNKIDSTDSDLATVATSGSYNDLLNKPTIPSASTDLTDTASLVRTTDLATVATTGDYNDLVNTPSVSASGYPTDFTGANTLSASANNAYMFSQGSSTTPVVTLPDNTSLNDGDVVILSRSHTGGSITLNQYDQNEATARIKNFAFGNVKTLTIDCNRQQFHVRWAASDGLWLLFDSPQATVAITGAYGDLTGQPTNLSQFTNDQGYITSVASASTTTAGIIEIADATETSAGTSNALAVSPLGLATEIGNLASTDLSDGADLLKTSDKGTTIGDVVEVVDVGGSVAGISALDGRNLTNLTYANITGTPSLATVATTGDYNDLINTPSSGNIPFNLVASDANLSANNAYHNTRASGITAIFNLPNPSGLSDGDVFIISRENAGLVEVRQHNYNAQPAPTALIDFFGTLSLTKSFTCNQQQIFIRFDSGNGEFYFVDKPQALVATSGDYDDLTNKPTSDDLTSDHTGVNYTGALNASITTHLSGIDSALASVGASGYPVQTAIGGLDETGTGGSDNSTSATLNTALVLTAASANDVEVKLPLISTASDGDVVIILRSRAGSLKITRNDSETVGNPITYIDQGNSNSVTITNNQQQIHVRFDSAGQGRWFIFDKAQAVVATSGSYNDLSNKPTSDDLTSDHTGVNYTGALNASITDHLSGIDNKFGTLGTASTNASTDFLSATGADSLGGNLDTNSHEIVTSANNDNITLRPNGTGWVKIGGNTNPGEVRLYCETSDQHWVGLKSPTHSDFGSNPSVTWRLPITDAANPGDALVSDGSGNLSFTTISGGGGGGYSYSTETSNLTAQANYHYSCGAGDESFTIQLPTSGISAGSEIRIKNMGTGTITIDPQTRQIDGSSNNYTLDVQFSAITLVSTGANWEII